MNFNLHSGYIGQELILKKTLGGKSVLNFSVGVRKNKDETIWLNYTAFEQKAEFIATNFKKGSFIILQSSYDTDEVDKEGRKIIYPKFIVHTVDFGNKVKEDSEPKYNPPYEPTPPDEDEEFNTGPLLDISSDDLPF